MNYQPVNPYNYIELIESLEAENQKLKEEVEKLKEEKENVPNSDT